MIEPNPQLNTDLETRVDMVGPNQALWDELKPAYCNRVKLTIQPPDPVLSQFNSLPNRESIR